VIRLGQDAPSHVAPSRLEIGLRASNGGRGRGVESRLETLGGRIRLVQVRYSLPPLRVDLPHLRWDIVTTRTKALFCAAWILGAGAAASVAQTVYSANTVGSVPVVVDANKFVLVCNPLTNTSTPNTVGNLIGTTNLPVTSMILKWDYAAARFNIYTRGLSGNGWLPSSGPAVTLNPGEGFFIRSPVQQTIKFVGDVLDARDYGIQTNILRSGYDLVGSKEPLSGSVFDLGLNIPGGTLPQNYLLKWNVVTQRYDIYYRVLFGTMWSPAVPRINVGEGFFTHLAGPIPWVQNFTVQ